ncbi:trypsin alpha-3-like [Topomyia yanbarensis]|uniref:trypsin alpha-3-like n=1 Tax=Topomyia yanbarensis TaxID=2498891 RepID=UPI00273AEF8E|nr:trypsin alpha-3-like [Topomyia yanbarensis]
MKLTLACSLILVAGVLSSDSDASGRLTGGTATLVGQFPAAVSIDSPYNLNCGGTIVNLQHVLTAAWCVMHPTTFGLVNTHWLRIIAGDLNLVPGSYRREIRSVSHVFVHPNYDREANNNDLAVLRVDRPFPEFHNTIEPAIMNSQDLAYQTPCQYVGWGAPSASGPLNPTQRTITVPIMAIVECNVATVHNFRILTTMICAGSLAATPNTTCQGNIGGGIYCNGRLTGVLIFGLACGAANQPGVYVDIRQYRQWIEAQFSRTDTLPTGWVPQPL